MRNALIAPKHSRRARRIVTNCLALLVAGAAGCNCYEPRNARCGLGDPCSPVALEDPFPDDQCVPPKHVDPDHYGYVRPNWRVLGERYSPCCPVPYEDGEYDDPAMPAPILEVAPEPELIPLDDSRPQVMRPTMQDDPDVMAEGILRPASFSISHQPRGH